MSAHFEFVTRSGIGTIKVLVDWPAHRETMVSMRASGSTKLDLAEHYGVSFSAIERVISTLQLPSIAGGRGLPVTPAWAARKKRLSDIKVERKPTTETERTVKLLSKMRRCLTCVSNDVANPWFKSAHAGVRMCSDHRNMSVGMD